VFRAGRSEVVKAASRPCWPYTGCVYVYALVHVLVKDFYLKLYEIMVEFCVSINCHSSAIIPLPSFYRFPKSLRHQNVLYIRKGRRWLGNELSRRIYNISYPVIYKT
jgi:hypothetical protein